MGIVPYTFQTQMVPFAQTPALDAGVYQCIHFTMSADLVEWMVARIGLWFAERPEVVLVDYGTSDKQGIGYLIMEWQECQADSLFIAILEHEEIIDDYSVYTRREVV